MIDLGTVRPGSTIRIPFASFKGADGSSITMTNYAAADVQIYKDGGTTQRASSAGITATTDFDSQTGLHLAIIDLSDNTTADFYAAGSEYLVAVADVTIDTQTVRTWVARFRIGYDGAVLDTTIATLASQTSFTLTDGPADNNALVGCVAIIHDAASSVQRAIGCVSAYTGSTKTVTLAADPAIFTMAAKDNISFFPPVDAKWLGAVVQTGRDIGANVLLSSGTGTGQISLSSGAVTAGTVTDKTDYSLAPTTGLGNQTANITGNLSGSVGSVTAGVTLAASQHVIVDSGTVTTLTNLPAITAGWLTASGIAAGALNGKGDWLLSSGYTAPDNVTISTISTKIGTPADTSIAKDIANLSTTIAGATTQVTASSGSLDRGTARKADTTAGTPASTSANTLTTDSQYLSASPANTTATVNGVASVGLWQTLTFLCGAAKAQAFYIVGHYQGGAAPRVADIYAYDYVSLTWRLISSTINRLNNSASDATYGPYAIPSTCQKNLTAGDGEVKLAIVSGSTNTGDIMALDYCYINATTAGPTVADIAAAVKANMIALYYPDGVWYDNVGGVTGTALGTNGLRTNPSLTLADAAAIASSLNITQYQPKPGSTLTLDRSMAKTTIGGRLSPGGWFLALGGQDISGATINYAELITGTSTAASGECFIYDSQIGTSSWGEVDFHRCHAMDATITLVQDAAYLFDTFSFVPFSSAPIIDFNASTGNRRAVIANSSGVLTIKNLRANNVVLIHGGLDVTFDSTCTGGVVISVGSDVRITNNGSGMTFAYSTLTLAQWAALAAMFDGVETGTARTAGSPASTQIQLGTGASSQDSFYNGAAIELTGGTGVKQSRRINSYVGATRMATVDAAWTVNPDATTTYLITGRLVS